MVRARIGFGCTVSLTILTGLTYVMVWVNLSVPEDFRGRGEESYFYWFWLKLILLFLLWAVHGANCSLQPPISLLNYIFASKGQTSHQPLRVPYTYVPDHLHCACVWPGCISGKAHIFHALCIQSTKRVFMTEWVCYRFSDKVFEEREKEYEKFLLKQNCSFYV